MRKVLVTVHGARSKAVSYQCSSCSHFEFETESSGRVLSELRETPLKIKQRLVKLSKDRLGLYLNSNIVRSLGLKKGEELLISVPDDDHILIERERS